MSSSSDADSVALLNNVAFGINCYLGIFIFIFGTTGNIFNILVLSQKNLRSNPCGWLFLMSSIASIIAFSSGLTPRILSLWNRDLSATNPGVCKLRSITSFASLTATAWFIALATIDRWLSSSVITVRRQKSTLKNAQLGTIIIICLSIGIHIQMLVCYDANLIGTPQKCYGKSPQCRLVSDLSFAIITILSPLLTMMIFGLMTISHVRETHRRVHQMNTPTTDNHGNETRSSNVTEQQRQHKRIDRQLLIMLFTQIILLTILFLPVSIERFYLTFTVNKSKSTLQITIDNFVFNLFVLLFYLANGMSFYIYTLSGGSVFRKGLMNVLQIFHRII